MTKELDKFGRLVIDSLRDSSISNYLMLRDGRAAAPSIQTLMHDFASFTPEQKSVVDAIVSRLISLGLHDLLFGLQDAHDRGFGIEVIVDGVNIAEKSEMLQGEPLGEDGWVIRFSKFPNFPAS
jgi:hypothetical protein